MGGYRVQGRGESGAAIIHDALAIQEAGVFSMVLEVIPHELAKEITHKVGVPTIGIGAGAQTDAQVIVWQDLVGLNNSKPAKFVKQFANVREIISQAALSWADEVVSGKIGRAHV